MFATLRFAGMVELEQMICKPRQKQLCESASWRELEDGLTVNHL
jgi:hypothetical protein